MKLTWRNKQYNFDVKSIQGGPEKLNRNSNIDKNIYAFDTESVLTADNRYEIQTIQLGSPYGEHLEYLPHKEKGLRFFLDIFVDRYYREELQNKECFMYAHNLTYDWLQLVKDYPDLLAMARTGLGLSEDYVIWEDGGYILTLLKGGLFVGNAPHFTLEIRTSKKNKVKINFRDTFSFFPSSLGSLGKTLGLDENKLERQEDLGKRDYRLEKTSKEKLYFEKYAMQDAKVTRLVAEQIRELHIHAGMTKIRVSAPGFAINYLYKHLPQEIKLDTGVNDNSIMQLILDSYAGGRTGGVYHGYVDDISVLDFHSSYPTSMTSLPSFLPTMQYIKYEAPEELTESDLLEIIDEYHCFLKIDGYETDAKYPTLIKSVKGKLTPIYGEFKEISTTGVEVYVGLKSKSLHITKVHELVLLIEMSSPPLLPFKNFALDAYKRKAEAGKGTPEYISAKLVLNSSYGKLIESRTVTPIGDDVAYYDLPYIEGAETEFGKMYYAEYIESLKEDHDDWKEIWEPLCVKITESFPEEQEIKWTAFKNLSLTELEYGYYAIPAAASLITATSRARLLALMKCTGAVYWDTDSVFVKDFDREKFNEQLVEGTKLLPNYIVPLKVGEELGELDIEIEHAKGYLAGVKRYYIFNEDHVKKALHGIPTAPFDEALEMIKALATGSDYSYLGRGKPTTAKETKDVNEIGLFKSKEYTSAFTLDERLEWKDINGNFVGVVKNFDELVK